MQQRNGDAHNGEAHAVYNATTEEPPEEKKPIKIFVVPTEILSRRRCLIKVVEVLLSFMSFVLEELVTSCMNCMPLYFFEFFSCSAFLFTLLLLILLSTVAHTKVGINLNFWAQVDFLYTFLIGVLFLCSSLAFAIKNEGTVFEQAAAAFGILSSVVFILDFVVLVRTLGVPSWKTEEKMSQDGDGAATEVTVPELQPLNTLPNGTGGD